MTQKDRRLYLINYLLSENSLYKNYKVSDNEDEQCKCLRTLFNIQEPHEANRKFLKVQDDYLQEEIRKKKLQTLKI